MNKKKLITKIRFIRKTKIATKKESQSRIDLEDEIHRIFCFKLEIKLGLPSVKIIAFLSFTNLIAFLYSFLKYCNKSTSSVLKLLNISSLISKYSFFLNDKLAPLQIVALFLFIAEAEAATKLKISKV